MNNIMNDSPCTLITHGLQSADSERFYQVLEQAAESHGCKAKATYHADRSTGFALLYAEHEKAHRVAKAVKDAFPELGVEFGEPV